MNENAKIEQAEVRVRQLREKEIIASILDRLSEELPNDLHYHAAPHTFDVFSEAIRFSILDDLDQNDVELLAIAAAYHDAGYLESPIDNEHIGAEMAKRAMQAHSYKESQIELVRGMILDTKLVKTESGYRQVARSELSKYLLDADLSNLGRDDFFQKAELQRREVAFDRPLFYQQLLHFLSIHNWQTEIAKQLRNIQKQANIQQLKRMLDQFEEETDSDTMNDRTLERLSLLAKLPLLLNSALETGAVISVALDHLKKSLKAEAATIFTLDEGNRELTFWALQGGDNNRLKGTKMPLGEGLVGWVIEHQEPALVPDVKDDQRFYGEIDKEGAFETKDVICVPLTAKQRLKLGAMQVLNKKGDDIFSSEDLIFAEQFSHHLALAIENARLFESLKKKNNNLKVLQKQRTDMLAVIAHEFRTPLSIISGSEELLSSGALKTKEQIKNVSHTLSSGVARLTRLISQVQNLTAASKTELQLQKTTVFIEEVLDALQMRFGSTIDERNLEYITDLESGAERVHADATLLLVVLSNLLSNAIRFTPDGGKISVSIIRRSGLVEFSVKDNGIGIPEDQQGLIFENFYEVQRAAMHSSGGLEFMAGGLGIGLSTVREILERHKSPIEVNSKPGEGSEFLFRLPIAKENSQ